MTVIPDFGKSDLEKYFDRLWPICRSITGNGLRESLRILNEIIPLELTEVPTGTKVFDWDIPREWNVRAAFIITPDGKKICDLQSNNLHVVSYSTPVNAEMEFGELNEHLHSILSMPDAIPYLTSYYRNYWGFCITENERKNLPREGKYKVVIDSELKIGSLTYGQCVLKGETEKEILFSTYLCHPSLANNELSGPLLTAFLYRRIASFPKRKYTYRFLFAPETIGVIAFLSRHGKELMKDLSAGYVVTCVGDGGALTYKRSKDPSRNVDRIAEHVLKHAGEKYSVTDFSIGGSDERQYCSPGFDLPVGSLMRTMYQRYPEYHTSLDNRSLMDFDAMLRTITIYADIARAHELNAIYRNTVPFCEPQLGKRGLYPQVGGQKERADELSAILHLLSWANGKKNLLEIAERNNSSILSFEGVVSLLMKHGLLETA